MLADWLPDMDLNHDKQIQSLLCYRYTIGHGNGVRLNHPAIESRNCGVRSADCEFFRNAAFATMQSPIRNPQSAIRN